MRPIRLSLQYFGSYTDKQTIDFDLLGTKGLYLITGDTGSGKTTIFDAILYALYGIMSGKYRSKDTMRSTLAQETDKTEVELVFEFSGTQYTVTRSMDYMRPAKRGGGLTKEDGKATISWSGCPAPLKNTSEVDAKIKEILGITKEQFSQIAMIAQGDFMKLLMTDTNDRTKLFSKIFRTENYEALQERISKECKDEEKRLSEAKVSVNTIIGRVQCDDDSALCGQLNQAKDEKVFTPVATMIDIIDKIMCKDKTLLEEWNRKKEEQEEIVRKCDTNLEIIKKHDKAAKELPQKQDNLKKLQDIDLPAQETALAEACKAKDDIRKLNDEAAQIEGSLDDYDKLDKQRKKYDDANAILEGIGGLDGRKAKNEATLVDNERKKEKLCKELEQLGNPELDKQRLEEKKKNLEDYYSDLKALEKKQDLLITEQKEYLRLDNEASKEENSFTTKRDLFYAAQAGILAETLEGGKPCPVCGSIHHPSKAQKNEGAPTKEQLDELENTANNARKKVNVQSEKCEGIRSAIKDAEDRLTNHGLSINVEGMENLPTQIENLRKHIKDLEKNINRKKAIPGELEQNSDRHHKLEDEKNAIVLEESKANNMRNEAIEQIETLQKKCIFNDKKAAEKAVGEKRENAQKLQKKIEEEQQAFNDIKEKIIELKGQINTLNDTLKNVVTLNQEEEETKKKNATTELNTHITPFIDTIKGRNTINNDALKQLQDNAVQLERIEKRYQWLKTLSDTVQGDLNGKEKIKLETYILSGYFERIIRKANLRLLKMTNNQYELRHKREAANKTQKTGLDLDIVDHHNGKIRTVKSLSGGESFMSSLSLALGLSDEIQSSCGGIHLDTMFVDEGFGSLDEESRILARNTLQKLSQEGNRLIGVISHVPELKAIERQIQVRKDHNGVSTAKVVLL